MRLPVNSDLALLQPYPFEKLRQLFAGVAPAPTFKRNQALDRRTAARDAALHQEGAGRQPRRPGQLPDHPGHATPCARPSPAGSARRYGVPAPDAATQVLPVNGSREALFAFAQTVVDRRRAAPRWSARIPSTRSTKARRCSPARSRSTSIPCRTTISPWTGRHLPEATWREVQLVYVCSPGNPTGKVMDLDDWKALFELSDRHGFVIASDECYSEIYFDERQAAAGRPGRRRAARA
jgi:N-succinyldiaminopimelate aminotransferase